MSVALPVHPFPARMAPELALDRLPRRLDGGLRVLDPMMGSGTIPVLASLQGYRAAGVDSDPLAVIIARTNGRKLPGSYLACACRAAERARARSLTQWSHPDPESQEFIDYWFDRATQRRLGALASEIAASDDEVRDQLWCAFSRLIITKDAGASRARDVSHSRPHRVRDGASFNPIERFVDAANAIVKRHRSISTTRPVASKLRLIEGDARRLPIGTESIDLVMTSPPYLQAIDYLRGHRMSLVWMGHTIGELRALRGASIGTERGDDTASEYRAIAANAIGHRRASPRGMRILARYVADLAAVLSEIHRVLRRDGQATLVVADATLEGFAVSINAITQGAARAQGLTLIHHHERGIPTASRYLPPPVDGGSNSLDKRMKIEHCLTFSRT